VTGGAFVLAVFGWGLGFYGPPVFLGILSETRGWSPGLISGAITVHYLVGAAVSAKLPALHARFGAARSTQGGALLLAFGVVGWSLAAEPWQLFPVSLISGAGWAATSSAALNAIIAPWFVRARPTALGMAYNGASVGGIIFSPLWVAATQVLGFPLAASAIAVATVITIWIISAAWFSRSPAEMGLRPDGDAEGAPQPAVTSPHAVALPGALLWRDRTFLTLAAGMALALFAQLGLFTHIFSLLVPAMGAQQAGLAMSAATILALAGRMGLGWIIQRGGDRRHYASANYAIQLVGSLLLLAAGGSDITLLIAGVLLFGLGAVLPGGRRRAGPGPYRAPAPLAGPLAARDRAGGAHARARLLPVDDRPVAQPPPARPGRRRAAPLHGRRDEPDPDRAGRRLRRRAAPGRGARGEPGLEQALAGPPGGPAPRLSARASILRYNS
jgi:hypothetical protein